MAQIVGVLVSKGTLKNGLKGCSPYESFALYDLYGSKHGVKPIFFSLDDIRFSRREVRAYIRTGAGHYESRMFPLPRWIHHRTRPFGKSVKKLIQLKSLHGLTLYNANNRLDKWDVYSKLVQNPEIKPHLPETSLLTLEESERLLDTYSCVYLKPTNKSLAIGLVKVERVGGDKVRVSYPRKTPTRILASSDWRKLQHKLMKQGKYLVQQAIPLASLEGCPYDLRVSALRGREGKWQVAGQVAKVGPSSGIATNVSVGGRALPFSSVYHLSAYSFEEISAKIDEVVLRAADQLGEMDAGLADLGFDVGIDHSGNVWIIEVNGRDLRITFRQAREFQLWNRTFEYPMAYAAYLAEQKEEYECTEEKRRGKAVVTPGNLPMQGLGAGSVEISVRERVSREAGEYPVTVFGKNVPPLGKAIAFQTGISPTSLYLKQVTAELVRLQPEVIQIENRPLFISAIRRACPSAKIVLYLHSETFIRPPNGKPKTIGAELAQCDLILTNSEFMKRRIAERFPMCLPKIDVLPLGVDVDQFHPIDKEDEKRIAVRERLRIANKKVILYVGRIIAQKSVHVLLDVFPQIKKAHPDAHLLVVGSTHYSGDKETRYLQLVRKRMERVKGDVTWITATAHEKLVTYYQIADLLVTPSRGSEAYGLVNLEGMATGLPVVSTTNGGIPEVIQHGKNGILIEPKELQTRLAEACIELLYDPVKAEQLGKAARQRVQEKFSWEEVAKKEIQLTRSLISCDDQLKKATNQ
ncbi:YheC/YheD family protein [Mechercharimyces sp. CAU 1602]|uniref:YheC/YheD family protein n=1 Tax=Mechercharimyces sp. CAU 1602 TaxID=2973933 RepID=UPI002162C682|nr:YheC/YheD family protein [Mechercharimyces sp. CAU 1602]MCS1351193.1 YheC/YheD family protein [Mechercharimyces sp. CAU 1602]